MYRKQIVVTNNTVPAAGDLVFHCILFDLGHTLWQRDGQQMEQLEPIANQRAMAMLRQAGNTHAFPGNTDNEAGQWLRKALHEQFRLALAQDPYIEPTGAAMLAQIFRAAEMDIYDEAFREALFETLNVRIAQSRILYPDALSTLEALQQRSLQLLQYPQTDRRDRANRIPSLASSRADNSIRETPHRSSDFALGVVTNRFWGGAAFRTDLATLGLLNYFNLEQVMTSADLHIRKPNPAIFALALESCNADADKTVMVGDSLTADVAGSQQIGIFAVWKPQRYDEVKDYLVSTEGISVQEYNQRQFALWKQQGAAEPPDLQTILSQDASDLDLFARGAIRPQLIINNLNELLAWL